MDGCPLGLGLVVEDKPIEFSCKPQLPNANYSIECGLHTDTIDWENLFVNH